MEAVRPQRLAQPRLSGSRKVIVASSFETHRFAMFLRMSITRTTVSPVILRRERKRASKDDGPPLVPRILRARHILRDGREAASSG